MASPTDTSSIRKAAVLIRSLDSESAARLLAQLAPQEAQALRAALREVGPVDESELSYLADELQQAKNLPLGKQPAVVLELSEHAADHVRPRPAPSAAESRLNSQLADLRQLAASAHMPPSPFHILVETDPRSLGGFLEREHVQTVAVVLSYLPAKKAAEVLNAFGDERQTEVIQRLLELGDTDTETLSVVERSLEQWLITQRREQIRRADRLAIVRSILEATQDSTRQTILLRLQQRGEGLASQIGSQIAKTTSSSPQKDCSTRSENTPPQTTKYHVPTDGRCSIPTGAMKTLQRSTISSNRSEPAAFAFDELAALAIAELSAVLRVVPPEIMQCALIGASERLLARLQRVLPRRQYKQIRQQLRTVGATRLSDVEAAQRAVADGVRRLILQGIIEQPVRLAS